MSKKTKPTDKNKLDQVKTAYQEAMEQKFLRFLYFTKQEAAILDDLDEMFHALIIDNTSVVVLFQSIFFYWLMLEASLNNVTQAQVDSWSMPLGEAVVKIFDVINKEIDRLPDTPPSLEMSALGKKLDDFQKYFPEGAFDLIPPLEELEKQTEIVHKYLNTVYFNLMRKHHNLVALNNALFAYWIRLTTLCSKDPEAHYQKIGFYLSEILAVVQKEVPKLFQRVN